MALCSNRWLLPAVLLTAACSARPEPAPVPMFGGEPDLQVLAGTWSGEYSSAQSGRSGRIRFELAADRAEARGDVLMIPGAPDREQGLDRDRPLAASGGSETLTISFVRASAEDETVSGTLDPYRDPQCECLLSTTFVGRVSRDRIEGTYTSKGPPGFATVTGRWRVDRRTD